MLKFYCIYANKGSLGERKRLLLKTNISWPQTFEQKHLFDLIKDRVFIMSYLCLRTMRILYELFWVTHVGCGLQMYVGSWSISTWCRHTPSVRNLDHYQTISIQLYSARASDYVTHDVLLVNNGKWISDTWTVQLFWLGSTRFQCDGESATIWPLKSSENRSMTITQRYKMVKTWVCELDITFNSQCSF